MAAVSQRTAKGTVQRSATEVSLGRSVIQKHSHSLTSECTAVTNANCILVRDCVQTGSSSLAFSLKYGLQFRGSLRDVNYLV